MTSRARLFEAQEAYALNASVIDGNGRRIHVQSEGKDIIAFPTEVGMRYTIHLRR